MNARHLLPLVALMALTACAGLTEPYSTGSSGSTGAAEAQTTAPTAKPAPTPAPAPKPRPAAQQPQITASHILIAYKGAMRANPEVTRTKAQARKLAEQIDARAKKGENFAQLAKKYSDGPSGARGGDLGTFAPNRMVKPFADAVIALKPGQISGVVETPFGFHIIKRVR